MNDVISQPHIGIILVMATMTSLTLGLRHYQCRCQPSAEWVRKLMHMGGGITALSFPWLFNELWPVAVLAGLLTLQFAAMRCVRSLRAGIGRVLGAVQRRSVGEFCFPLAVVILFGVSHGDPALYCAPVLCLTFADTAAALVGRRWGVLRFTLGGDSKTIEGSCAFFAVSCLSCVGSLSLLGPLDLAASLGVACIVAPTLTLIEATAGDGLDNLLIPLSGYLCLKAAPTSLFLDIEVLLAVVAIVAGPLLLWGLVRRDDRMRLPGGAR